MPSNNVFQYSKIRTRKRSAKKSIKTGQQNGIQLFLESGIHCAGIRNPVPGIRNPQHGIQNPRPSWIPLHEAKLVSDTVNLWPSPVLLCSRSWKDINKNAILTRRSIVKISQTYYEDFIALVFLNNECLLFDFVGRKEV